MLSVNCVDCQLGVTVCLSLFLGVFLESRVTSAKVNKTYFLLHRLLPQSVKQPDTSYEFDMECFIFSVCTCVVHKRCHQQVVTVCPLMKKPAKEQVAIL